VVANPLDNLIELSDRTPAKAREIRVMGGRTVTEKQRTSQKLRWIRERMEKGQLVDGDEKWLLQRVSDRDTANLDLLNWIDKMRRDASDEKIEASLLNTYNQILKTIHGEKHLVKSENLNINVSLGADEFARRLGAFKETEE